MLVVGMVDGLVTDPTLFPSGKIRATKYLGGQTIKEQNTSLQGHSVDKKMAKPHEQLFFLKFKKMATFLRLSFLKN